MLVPVGGGAVAAPAAMGAPRTRPCPPRRARADGRRDGRRGPAAPGAARLATRRARAPARMAPRRRRAADRGGAGRGPPRQRRRVVPLGQLADIRDRRRAAHDPRRGGPARRLRLRRHRPGAARHRRLRRRGQGGVAQAQATASSQLPPGTYLEWTGQYELLERDARADEDRRPADAASRRAPALPAVPELHRGADRPPLDPVRAGRQRLAAVAARLPALDGGAGSASSRSSGSPRRPAS